MLHGPRHKTDQQSGSIQNMRDAEAIDDLGPGVWYSQPLAPRWRRKPGGSTGPTCRVGSAFAAPAMRSREDVPLGPSELLGVADERSDPHPVRHRARRSVRRRTTLAAG